MRDFVFAFVACLLTLYAQHAGLNAVLASAAVIMPIGIFACFNRAFDSACGSAFAGMTSVVLSSTLASFIGVAFLAAFTGLVVVAVKHAAQRWPNALFNGHGGRLGFTAVIGVASTFTLLDKEFIPFIAIEPSLSLFIESGIVLAAAAGALLPRVLVGRRLFSFSPAGRVVVSATMGIVAGALLHFLPAIPALWSAAFYAGSFAAMSSQAVLSTLRSFLLAGLCTGIILLSLLPWLYGFGGLLGLSAFLACILYSRARLVFSARP